MPKLTFQDLKKFRDKINKKYVDNNKSKGARVTVHMGTCGIASGAQQIYDTLVDELKK